MRRRGDDSAVSFHPLTLTLSPSSVSLREFVRARCPPLLRGGQMHKVRPASLLRRRVAWTCRSCHVSYAGAPRTPSGRGFNPPNPEKCIRRATQHTLLIHFSGAGGGS